MPLREGVPLKQGHQKGVSPLKDKILPPLALLV